MLLREAAPPRALLSSSSALPAHKPQGMGDDDESMSVGGSVTSGVSGLSAIEQDLSGFDMASSRRGSTAGASTGLARVTEEGEAALPSPLASPAQPKVRGEGGALFGVTGGRDEQEEQEGEEQAGPWKKWKGRRALFVQQTGWAGADRPSVPTAHCGV